MHFVACICNLIHVVRTEYNLSTYLNNYTVFKLKIVLKSLNIKLCTHMDNVLTYTTNNQHVKYDHEIKGISNNDTLCTRVTAAIIVLEEKL